MKERLNRELHHWSRALPKAEAVNVRAVGSLCLFHVVDGKCDPHKGRSV